MVQDLLSGVDDADVDTDCIRNGMDGACMNTDVGVDYTCLNGAHVGVDGASVMMSPPKYLSIYCTSATDIAVRVIEYNIMFNLYTYLD